MPRRHARADSYPRRSLKSVFPERPSTLLYVYWEPSDEQRYRLFAQHRAEADSFAEGLADPHVRFASLAYSDLWDAWSQQDRPSWLPDHVELLHRRYVVPTSNLE
jgi:hypothetical protein